MVDLFAMLFELLGMYSSDLGQHLRGYNPECSGFDATPTYNIAGFSMVFIPLFIGLIYYKILDRVALNSSLHWFLFSVLSVVICFLISIGITLNDLGTDNFCRELQIQSIDCIMFGVTVSFYTFVLFGIYSLGLRFLSTNCRYTPF